MRRAAASGSPAGATSSKECLRLLKALRRHGGPVHAKACGGIDVPIDAGGVRRSIAFSDKVVSEAMREDLLERSGGGVRLSASGASRLSRALERDAPFLAQHRPLVRERVDVDGAAEAVLVDTAEKFRSPGCADAAARPGRPWSPNMPFSRGRSYGPTIRRLA